MKNETLLNLVSSRDDSDLWSRIEVILGELDDSSERESYLVKIMSAIVFGETMRHLNVISPATLDGNSEVLESAVRRQVRKSISNLNEMRPFDALEVQEKVLAAVRTHRSTISALSYDLDINIAYMQALQSLENSRIGYDDESNLTRQLGHRAHEELIKAAHVPLTNEEG